MANSRLERIGTIFSRTTALLKKGAIKPEDKPLWYDIYKAFPPKIEPTYSQPVSDIKIRPIFYKEDELRAKYHQYVKTDHNLLTKSSLRSETQIFLQTYAHLEKQGALDKNAIFEVAAEMAREKVEQERAQRKTQWLEDRSSTTPVGDEPKTVETRTNLLEEFSKFQSKPKE